VPPLNSITVSGGFITRFCGEGIRKRGGNDQSTQNVEQKEMILSVGEG